MKKIMLNDKYCLTQAVLDGRKTQTRRIVPQKVLDNIKQFQEDMEEKKLNLKPFDLQKAKEGKPVRTRDGRKARIVCFDRKLVNTECMIVLIDDITEESVHFYTREGRSVSGNRDDDLMTLPGKGCGVWINIRKDAIPFESREDAERNAPEGYVPVKVDFEI